MKKRLTTLMLIIMVLISACNLPTGKGTETPQGENAIQTMAAQTVEAMSTAFAATSVSSASQKPTNPPVSPQPLPTQTLQAATAVMPSATLAPANPQATATKTQTPIPCDRAAFVEDVTINDGTVFSSGTTFTKTWRLKNNGTCTWDTNYRLIFVNGDAMGAPANGSPLPGAVPPGGTVDLSVTLTTPVGNRTYTGNFMIQNASGARFGIGNNADKAFWVSVVVGSTATPGSLAVTSTALGVSPSSYNGTCSSGVKFTFTGSITANRAGTVKYHFVRSDGASGAVQTLTYTSAGTVTVTDEWTLSGTYTGWEQIYIDEPNHQSMARADFTLTCQ